MSSQPRIAYSIPVICDCIIRDTEVYRTYDSRTKKLARYHQKQKLLDSHPAIKKIIDVKFIRSLDNRRGKYVGRVGWMPAELIITDQRIREMCRNMFTLPKSYAEKTGIGFGPCPGHGKMSACPPFSYTAHEAREKFDAADIFIALQSVYFTLPPKIRGWQDVLLHRVKKEIEKQAGEGTVTAAFGAGPCQLCNPNPCLGGGECRIPEKRLFALESVGVPVARLCDDMTLLTGDKGWKIRFMKYYGTPKQSHKEWKLTFGIAVKLR